MTPDKLAMVETDDSGTPVAGYLFKLNETTGRYILRKYTGDHFIDVYKRQGLNYETVTVTSEDQTHGHVTADCHITVRFETLDETTSGSSGSGGGGGGGSSSGSSGGSSKGITAVGTTMASGPSLPSYVVTGTWVQNAAGRWIDVYKRQLQQWLFLTVETGSLYKSLHLQKQLLRIAGIGGHPLDQKNHLVLESVSRRKSRKYCRQLWQHCNEDIAYSHPSLFV